MKKNHKNKTQIKILKNLGGLHFKEIEVEVVIKLNQMKILRVIKIHLKKTTSLK